MASESHFIPNFDLRSVGLLPALTVGAALSSHAQTTDSGSVKPPATQSATPKAATPGQDADAAFTRADTNKDGKLSRPEAASLCAVEQRFDLRDTNQDQFVAREKFEAATKS